MPMWAAGSDMPHGASFARLAFHPDPSCASLPRVKMTNAGGFTLLELMVVVAIIALASAGVGFALRDSAQTRIEREGQRLVALLESARAQSRASGLGVRWHSTAQGFRFDGLPAQNMPQNWLSSDTAVQSPRVLLLGPEPIIGPQEIALISIEKPGRVVHIGSDGLRPFAIRP